MAGASYPKNPTPVDKIIYYGSPPFSVEFAVKEITEIARFLPGYIAQVGSHISSGDGYTDYDAYVHMTPVTAPAEGWIGYEDVDTNCRPAYIGQAYALDTSTFHVQTKLYKGAGFGIMATQMPYCTLRKGDRVAAWQNGQVMGPVLPANGGFYLGIPFSLASGSESNTHVVIPKGIMIGPDNMVEVTTASAQTIEVGFLSSETGTGASGDPDGLINALDTTYAGVYGPLLGGAAAATGTGTLGELLQVGAPTEFKDANGKYNFLPKNYLVDYTTSNTLGRTVSITMSGATATAGRVWLHCIHPNLRIVGIADETQTTTTTATALRVQSLM